MSATKIHCLKTSSSRVVEQSSSYEITEKHRTKSVSFHLKYWLKLTYPVVASTTSRWLRFAVAWFQTASGRLLVGPQIIDFLKRGHSASIWKEPLQSLLVIHNLLLRPLVFLHHKNRLMWVGRVKEADALAKCVCRDVTTKCQIWSSTVDRRVDSQENVGGSKTCLR